MADRNGDVLSYGFTGFYGSEGGPATGVAVRGEDPPAVWVRLDADACKCIIEAADSGWTNAEISIDDDQLHLVAKICRQLGIGKQMYQVRFEIPATLTGYFDVEAYTMDEAEAAGAVVTEDMDIHLRATDYTGRVVWATAVLAAAGDIDIDIEPDWHNQTISAEES